MNISHPFLKNLAVLNFGFYMTSHFMDSSKEKSYYAKVARAFAAGTAGDMLSQAVVRGIWGSAEKFDFTDSLLSGMEGGAGYVAYPIAVIILNKSWKRFRDENENEDGNKLIVYLSAGAVATGITTAAVISLDKIRDIRMKTKTEIKVFDTYSTQLGPTVSIVATLGTLDSLIPTPRDSLGRWARNELILTGSVFGSRIGQLPYMTIKRESKKHAIFSGIAKAIVGCIVAEDASNHFAKIAGALL